MIFKNIKNIIKALETLYSISKNTEIETYDINKNISYVSSLINNQYNLINENKEILNQLLKLEKENKKQETKENIQSEEQKELWLKILDSGSLFMINNTLSIYDISLGISKEGIPVLYNQAKIYSKEEYDEIIKKISVKRGVN